MISISSPAVPREHRAPRRNWRIITGLAAGAAVMTGAFLPWVETVRAYPIPGVDGSHGRILAGPGVTIAAAGLYHLIRGAPWARWLAALAGFAAAGFSRYPLIQLTATIRTLGGNSMALARRRPGLWVTAGGALAAFATFFLPSGPAITTAQAGPAATTGPGAVPRAGRRAWSPALPGRARAVAGRWIAGPHSAGARRGLQVALGLVWLADAALQFQPYMFGRGFITGVLTPAQTGNPAAVASPALWAAHLIGRDVPAWNTAFALIQLAIAVGLLWRPAVRAALAVSIVWALSVWWLGEGLGGLLTGTASPVTGAPGAVILYALLAVLAWPRRGTHAGRGDLAGASPRAGWAKAAWVLLWASFACLVLQPAARAPRGLAAALSGQAAGEPGWLAAVDRWAAATTGGHGLAISITLAVLFALIAAGIFTPATRRPVLVLAGAVALAIWVIGENFGMILMGNATDPNSGPLLVLLAAAYWPPRPAAGPPAGPGARRVAAARGAGPAGGGPGG